MVLNYEMLSLSNTVVLPVKTRVMDSLTKRKGVKKWKHSFAWGYFCIYW